MLLSNALDVPKNQTQPQTLCQEIRLYACFQRNRNSRRRPGHQGRSGPLDSPRQPRDPFIEGDGTGRDIWKASQRVFDAAVEKAYGAERRIVWYEIFAGEKANNRFNEWFPKGTLDAIRHFVVAIKGPLTTPVGGGIRSLNVTLRQVLNLYACVRPVRYFNGVPRPVKKPEKLDIVIFRENTEDVYAGIEFQEGTEKARKLIEFLSEFGYEINGDPASASNRFRSRARRTWCGARSATPSSTTASW